ncbi:hypothetical protein BGW36DRAFT_286819 [Talaromyces proteolyticus]|uniref:Tachykinin family protein n=1 Tax=Talaromyces proteolyticus TaxID=1131652 RepID=A0AAD4L0I5_9EURO|nr:uncharacterized protein BGW36DRAFT_286819 [Talaromyces proteolyticus]KAH8703988.1 hypothetical protein BGW36DRAFT_286819 [Talaromyces proteolyticus]
MDHPVAFKPSPKRTSSTNNSNRSRNHNGTKKTSTQSPGSSPVPTPASSPGGFNFITVDPSSQTESSSSRTLIRANAGRYIWKRRKAGPSREKGGRTQPYEIPGPQKNDPAIKSEANSRIEEADDDVEEPSQVKKEEERVGRKALGVRMNENAPVVLNTRRRTGRRQDLMSGLNNGLRSPIFTSFGTEVPEEIVRRTFKYSASVVMAKMLPSAANTHDPNVSDVWLASAMRSPALLSAFIYGTLSHEFVLDRMQSGAPSKERRQKMIQIMVAENESITRINHALQDSTAQKTDELLMAVFLMGYSRYDEAAFAPDRNPHRSPLSDMQWANIYSYLDYDEVHVMGLIRLLEIRGGIDAIELHGLPEMMSLATVMFSSKFLRKPLFPFIPIIKTNGPRSQPDWPPPIQYLLRMYTGGEFPKLAALGAPDELVDLFADIYSYNAVVELYMQGIFAGSFAGSDAPVMADRRNWIQHRALSLDSADDLEIADTSPAYEALRLATVIYCLLTIFPLVPIMAPYAQLTNKLRQALCNQSRGWKNSPEYLLWVLVVGGIASTQPETTTWFAATLSQVAAVTKLSSWDDVKNVIKSVLWLGAMCDDRGEELWNKAATLRPQVEHHRHQQQQQQRSHQQSKTSRRMEESAC